MKYKIYKKIDRSHKLNKETKLYELIETPKYYIMRKGTILGFWHEVGEWLWSSGGPFISLEYFKSIEQAKSYLYCWHKENYSNDSNIEVSVVNYE